MSKNGYLITWTKLIAFQIKYKTTQHLNNENFSKTLGKTRSRWETWSWLLGWLWKQIWCRELCYPWALLGTTFKTKHTLHQQENIKEVLVFAGLLSQCATTRHVCTCESCKRKSQEVLWNFWKSAWHIYTCCPLPSRCF